jgi:hypothetical protein
MHGVLPTVHYLQDLGVEHFDLILEFGTWILEEEPLEAMKVRVKVSAWKSRHCHKQDLCILISLPFVSLDLYG